MPNNRWCHVEWRTEVQPAHPVVLGRDKSVQYELLQYDPHHSCGHMWFLTNRTLGAVTDRDTGSMWMMVQHDTGWVLCRSDWHSFLIMSTIRSCMHCFLPPMTREENQVFYTLASADWYFNLYDEYPTNMMGSVLREKMTELVDVARLAVK